MLKHLFFLITCRHGYQKLILAETNHTSLWAISYDPIYVSPIIVSLLICLGLLPIFGLIILNQLNQLDYVAISDSKNLKI